MKQPRELLLLSRAQKALVEAKTVDEVVSLRDQAQVAKAYAKKAKMGQELIIEASVIKIRAERKLGEMLSAMPLSRGGAPPKNGTKNRSHDDSSSVALRDLGITHSDSSRSQRIARLPERTFNKFLNECAVSRKEPTTASLLRLIKDRTVKNTRKKRKPIVGVTRSLEELVATNLKFETIYADPPWQYGNTVTRGAANSHYRTMTLDELAAEPVELVAGKNCHLHLWATSPFLPDAIKLMEAWGFTYKSSFVWVKPDMGLGNYWRISHELLLLGIRGTQPFAARNVKSWFEAKRQSHSQKPDEIRALIERVSLGPYLEMFGRQPVDGWTVYGDEV